MSSTGKEIARFARWRRDGGLLNRSVLLSAALLIALSSPGFPGSQTGTITVDTPNTDVRIAEGEDYATWQLGNPWDLDCPDWSGTPGNPQDSVWDERFTCDIVLTESVNVSNEGFPGAVYTGTSTATNPRFWLTFPGRYSIIRLANGSLFPVDTSRYRYLSGKVRYSGTPDPQAFVLYFFEDHAAAAIGHTRTINPWPQPNEWTIFEFDLWDPSSYVSPSDTMWQDFPRVRGLRVNPTNKNGVTFEFDWIRLTADPAAPAAPDSTTTVSWTASGTGTDTFVIEAVDADGATLELATAIPAGTTSTDVDLGLLPPGSYTMRVRSSGGASDDSTGHVLINEAPLLHFLQPDKQGDTERSYSKVEACTRPGDPSSCYDWSDFDVNDIYYVNDFQITNQGPPVQGYRAAICATEPVCPDAACIPDPYFPLMTCRERDTGIPAVDNCAAGQYAEIDTDRYRMFTYKFEVFGPRDCGRVARLVWGDTFGPPDVRVGEGMDIEEGLNTYVLGDLDNLWLATGANNGPTGHWNGTIDQLRFDVHEFWDARTFELHSFTLAPVDSAGGDGKFLFEWIDDDGDDNALIDFFYDLDTLPGSGNETPIVLGLSENAVNTYTWDTRSPTAVPPGEYYIYARTRDGLNVVVRYATGPLRVPGIRTVTNVPDTVDIDWLDISGTETEYRVERRRVGEAAFIQLAVLAANSTSYRDETALGGKAYEYRVLACNGSVCDAPLMFGPMVTRSARYFISDESRAPER